MGAVPMYKITRLPSGLRVATAQMPHVESLTVGVWVGVGGRYEPARLCGVSHFIEHLLFKGTHQRSARQISQTVEGIGGYLNAFTGEETTCYYAKASHRHLDTLLDVLADMYLHPRFAPADIAKERRVIKEELMMYRDQPDQFVHELLNELLWPAQPLGRSITGTPESLDAINRAALLDYKRRNYVAPKTVLAVAGRCEHDDIVRRAARQLRAHAADRPAGFKPATNTQRAPRIRCLDKNVEQAHLAIGIRSYSRHDRRRYAQKLLSVILGENMSSRLFQVVRERHGLAYSIHTSTTYFADTGAFIISAGLDPKRWEKALRLILGELKQIARRPPSALELRRAKDYSIGQMYLGLESTANQMMWLGEHLLAYGFIPTPQEVERQIEAVTTEAVQSVAADLFRDHRLSMAVITPGKHQRNPARLLTLQ